MTYPPQPGQPQQPYGQQPGQYGQGGHPQPGQFPQGQYQQHYGYPQGGGFGGPPPEKSRTGLWVGVSAAAVVVFVFVITAFVAPGFLLGDDDDDSGGTAGGNGNGAAELAQQIVDGFNNKDSAALTALTCGDADSHTTGVIKIVSGMDSAELGEVNELSDTEATAKTEFVYKGSAESATVELASEGGAWCWQGFTPGSGGSDDSGDSAPEPPSDGDSGSDADADQVASDFLDAINNGDADSAMSYVCDSAKDRVSDTVEQAASASADLTLDDMTGEGSGPYNGHVSGTVGGQAVQANLLISDPGDGLCVKGAFIS